MLKITDARVIITCPGRNFVTLKIETSAGIYGIGDATLNGRELAVASYLSDHVLPALIGRDAQSIEDIWQYLYKGAYRRRGPVTMSAIAAVDTALWDIKAKQAGLPLYQLLGGASRAGVMVYGHANGDTLEATLAEDGCSVYAYSEDLLSPGLIHIAETWRDMDALKAHFKAPHIAVWREASAALGIHDRDLSMFEAGEPKKL